MRVKHQRQTQARVHSSKPQILYIQITRQDQGPTAIPQDDDIFYMPVRGKYLQRICIQSQTKREG